MICKDICVPFVPSDTNIVREGLKAVGLEPGQVFLELGSGDGRNLILAAKEFGAYAIGYELNPELVEETKRKALKEGVANRVKVVQDTFMNAGRDLERADVVYIYLTPKVNQLIKPLLMRYPVKIISFRFPIPDLEPTKIISNLYIYDLKSNKVKNSVIRSYEELVKDIVVRYKPHLRLWDRGIVDVVAKDGEIVIYTKSKNSILPLYIEGVRVRVVRVH